MTNHLYDIFKHWGKDIYCISDTHFNDIESFEMRKKTKTLSKEVKTLSDYNNFIVKNINSKVGKNSCLIILGDVGDIEYIRKLKAKYKILIMGNHDKGASHYKRTIKQVKRLFVMPYNKELSYTSEEYDKSEDVRIQVMTEYPDSTHVEERVVTLDNRLFDEVYEGPVYANLKLVLSHEPADFPYAFNIHGHDHSNWYQKDGKHLNVCAEHIDYTPISLLTLLKTGVASKIDDIHRSTIDRATAKKANKV